ncbi:solute carrier organic anion transporter family member 6A1, partial [Castor canadensis]|uniref:Solute carrier organic anion transporter family member 6A1 n=1 Tax=Castor canadensis TaxID=51338 RepID=A0AC58MXA2_CASCN
ITIPTETAEPEEQNLEETCGLRYVVIPYCQRFNDIRCFLFFYCILVMCQGIIFGLVDLSHASFHKEYDVKTSEKLVLTLTYDVSSCLVAVFVAYYGGKMNRIKWIAFSSFLIGLGSFFFALPYFSAKVHKSVMEMEDICQEKKLIDVCPKSRSSFQTKYLTFFILGKIVQGIAGMPLYILGVTFLKDHVATHSSGIYLGIGDASEILGYGLGYTIGAPQLKGPENSTTDERIIFEPRQSKGAGFWWIDFLLASGIAWSTLIPILCFPSSIAGTERIRAEKNKHLPSHDQQLKDEQPKVSIKDLYISIRYLIKNPLFMCQAVSKAAESLVIIGVTKFLPAYLENQFILTPSVATMLTGVILIPGGSVGHLLGGVIVSKLKMSCKALMRFIVTTSIVSIIFLVLIIFVHCDPDKFAGINENYDGTGELGNLTAPCNSHCKCSSSIFYSVCGRDEVEYFSPCFAGCKRSKTLNYEKAYYNCSCIKNGLLSSDIEGEFFDALPGKCDTKCYKLPLFFAFFFSSIIFSCFSAVPLNLTIFRIVPERLHSLALGLSYVILRLLGTIPGPLIFEWTIQTSCTFRDSNKCGRKGRCWIFNKTYLAFILVGICK